MRNSETIIGKSPRAFERLVVQLLQAMGYGGEIKVRASHPGIKDRGIDGIIKEDILGFGGSTSRPNATPG